MRNTNVSFCVNKNLLRFFVVLTFIFQLMINDSKSQTFTRVTDPNNPVTNDQFESGGGSWIDINNDGYLDLFVSNGNLSNQNNSLYLNNKNGNFIKIVTGNIVQDGGSSIGSAWGDFDNDGYLDLFVVNRNNFGNFLYRGKGDTIFAKIMTGNIVMDKANSNSASWVDIDNDGNLDLYIINFEQNDFLYFNDGAHDFNFTKIDTGIVLGNTFSISGVWGDYDNDRDQDLFIGNAGSQNDFLFVNKGSGNFTKITINDGKSTLGSSWGDYDNDGDLDLFVANFLKQKNILYNNSGFPNYLLSKVDTSIISMDAANSVGSSWGDCDNDGDLDLFVANDGENNFLYRNNGPPNYSFTKIMEGSIVNDGGNSFGCVWGDYDNDGDLDLFVANRLNQKNFLYSNNGSENKWIKINLIGIVSSRSAIGARVKLKAMIDGLPYRQIRELTGQSGYNSQNLILHFGLKNSAIIDSLIIEWPSGINQTLTNINANQFLTIKEEIPKAFLRARFTVNVKNGTEPLKVNFTDLSISDNNFPVTSRSWDFNNDGVIDSQGQNPTWTYNKSGTYSVKLVISNGTKSDSLVKNNYIKASEPSGIIRGNFIVPDKYLLSQNYPNPFNPSTTIKFDLPKNSYVVLNIYNVNGQLVRTLVNGYRNAGSYKITWDGKNNSGISVASGIYIYIIKADSFTHVRRITLIK
jgi:PKD repeat protein